MDGRDETACMIISSIMEGNSLAFQFTYITLILYFLHYTSAFLSFLILRAHKIQEVEVGRDDCVQGPACTSR